MAYLGHIANGHIVLDEFVVLPEGARVRVDVVSEKDVETQSRDRCDCLDQLRKRIAVLPVKNPVDGFSNRDHDRLLYGGPS